MSTRDSVRAYRRMLGRRTVDALERNGFCARYFETAQEAAAYLEQQIQPGLTVGVGGSVTIRECGILPRLEGKGCRILDFKTAKDRQEELAVRRAQLGADVFLCSSNAVLQNGQLYNVDGVGNRVAAMTFGPPRVYVVAGINKVVRDIKEARDRVCFFTGPMINIHREKEKNPCAETGFCVNCTLPTRICTVEVLHTKRPKFTEFTVVIVGEELGF